MSVFGVGLCLLEMGLMQSVQSVYDKTNGKFLVKEFEELLSEFSRKYAALPLLVDLVRDMLKVNHEKRRDFVELKARLPDWFSLFTVNSSIKSTANRARLESLQKLGRGTSPDDSGKQSTKEEILEFFNIKEEGQKQKVYPFVSEHIDFSQRRQLGSMGEDAKRTSIMKDMRKTGDEDVFQANGIEKYFAGKDSIVYKAQMNIRVEKNKDDQMVERTYISYVPIDNQKDIMEAQKYFDEAKKSREDTLWKGTRKYLSTDDQTTRVIQSKDNRSRSVNPQSVKTN